MVAEDRVRTAEVVGSLCLATDLGMGFPFGLGLGSAVVAMRLANRLGVDEVTAVQTYYGCLLCYAGCTADADVQADLFPDGLAERWSGVMFASQRQSMAGVFRALGSGEGGVLRRTARASVKLPRAALGFKDHAEALCEVAEMLAMGVDLPPTVSALFRMLTERWDGGGPLSRVAGAELPLAIRIVHVARDASLQRLMGGPDRAVEVVRERASGAFDPAVVDALSIEMLAEPVADWAAAMAAEPKPHRTLEGAQIDDALATLAAFADLADAVGHSSAVADLAARAAKQRGAADEDVTVVRRAALVQDLGKVGVPFRIWQSARAWSADDWEKVRLHPYYTERTLSGSRFLNELGQVAGCHHERLDGSGYPRGVSASGLDLPARILAAADAYRSMIETRPGRPGLTADAAAAELSASAAAGTVDPVAVTAVLEAAGHRPARIIRPGGLTHREEQTLTLLAQGLATKQIGRALGVTPKTADHYVQQVYNKIGVATRAAAAVYAMQHGLAMNATREFSR
jgi:HD-GYP domain-containing protein (c-di-GMP phosphodiesterase class II)